MRDELMRHLEFHRLKHRPYWPVLGGHQECELCGEQAYEGGTYCADEFQVFTLKQIKQLIESLDGGDQDAQ